MTDAKALVDKLVGIAWRWGHGCAVDDISDMRATGDSYNESCRSDTEKAAEAVVERITFLEQEVARLRLSRDRTRTALENMRNNIASRDSATVEQDS